MAAPFGPVSFGWDASLQAIEAMSRAFSFAPERLLQSINGGWSFGNLIVNAANSSAPATELAIVSKTSYGQQIGRLMDAVDALVRRLPEADREQKEFAMLAATRATVEATKQDMARQRAERVIGDLTLLRNTDRDAYERIRTQLLAVLRD